jgi:anhydro-N-acetylmuramic acid kinase
MPRLAFGFMTGTSCDGLDGAAVRVEGDGLAIRCEVAATVSLDFGPLAALVRDFARGGAATAAETARLALDLAALHAEAVRRLRVAAGDPDLVAAHGQTVFHDPPASWQLVNPWPIAVAAGCPVVTDLRGADLAAGGQGAPITPIADWILFRHLAQTRAIVNLGGFCNITLLPAGAGPEAIRGRDLCACNHVLDAAAQLAFGAPFDADGAAAARGTPDPEVTAALRAMLEVQSRAGRSLGSADELRAELRRCLGFDQAAPATAGTSGAGLRPAGDRLRHPSAISALTPEDTLATATTAVATTIATAVNELDPAPGAILLAGGSVRNRALMTALAARCRAPITTTADFGIDPQYREAAAMAILGCLAADGAPVALPHATGARRPILWQGSWTNLPPARTRVPRPG